MRSCEKFSQRSQVLLLVALSFIRLTYAQVYECPISRLNDEALGRGAEQPLPLPTVPSEGEFSSAEYGTGAGGLVIPYTTAAAYGARYNSGSIVVTSEPTKNMPCV
jgi:hypothetical protein